MTTEDEEYPYFVTVEVHKNATREQIFAIFDAVADAAYAAQPEDRDWDIFVRARGPRPA